MQKIKLISGVIMALIIPCTSCNKTNQQIKTGSEMEQAESKTEALPKAEKWVSSPLRNQLILELDKPISEVWILIIGDPGNMPKYSSGLDKVETKITDDGKCS